MQNSKELPILTNEQYRERLADMLSRVDDNDNLRFYCILIQEHSKIAYYVEHMEVIYNG